MCPGMGFGAQPSVRMQLPRGWRCSGTGSAARACEVPGGVELSFPQLPGMLLPPFSYDPAAPAAPCQLAVCEGRTQGSHSHSTVSASCQPLGQVWAGKTKGDGVHRVLIAAQICSMLGRHWALLILKDAEDAQECRNFPDWFEIPANGAPCLLCIISFTFQAKRPFFWLKGGGGRRRRMIVFLAFFQQMELCRAETSRFGRAQGKQQPSMEFELLSIMRDESSPSRRQALFTMLE